jgi:hypothetical protein
VRPFQVSVKHSNGASSLQLYLLGAALRCFAPRAFDDEHPERRLRRVDGSERTVQWRLRKSATMPGPASSLECEALRSIDWNSAAGAYAATKLTAANHSLHGPNPRCAPMPLLKPHPNTGAPIWPRTHPLALRRPHISAEFRSWILDNWLAGPLHSSPQTRPASCLQGPSPLLFLRVTLFLPYTLPTAASPSRTFLPSTFVLFCVPRSAQGEVERACWLASMAQPYTPEPKTPWLAISFGCCASSRDVDTDSATALRANGTLSSLLLLSPFQVVVRWFICFSCSWGLTLA